jgi:hypothetical protein
MCDVGEFGSGYYDAIINNATVDFVGNGDLINSVPYWLI